MIVAPLFTEQRGSESQDLMVCNTPLPYNPFHALSLTDHLQQVQTYLIQVQIYYSQQFQMVPLTELLIVVRLLLNRLVVVRPLLNLCNT